MLKTPRMMVARRFPARGKNSIHMLTTQSWRMMISSRVPAGGKSSINMLTGTSPAWGQALWVGKYWPQ